MKQYEVTFSWQGRTRKEVVNAFDSSDAKKVIEARYPGAKTMTAFLK